MTSLPAFRAAHHHWIFPILAALLAGQWGLAFAAPARVDPAGLRGSVVSALLFLLVMGLVRHATILACFDRCAFKLAAAAAIAAPVFWGQSRTGDGGWWSPLRSRLAAIGAAAWALYLVLKGLQVAPWLVDAVFAILALLLWLGRSRADLLLASVGILVGVAIREAGSEAARIGLSLVWSVAVPLAIVDRVQARLTPRAPGAPRSPRRFLAVAVAAAVIGVYVVGPVFLTTDRARRQQRLARLAPTFPRQDPKTLSPLAARLREHVIALSATIGERDAYQPRQQARAREYVLDQFSRLGYAPKILVYRSQFLPSLPNGTEFSNVEAVLPALPADVQEAWIVGAHYDSAPGTSGADDNASGVAVLLETARLLKELRPARDVRFVAFGTEEPPSFGTRNMGSARYAQDLQENGVRVHGMISLEMLGYYNPRPGSQLYPPFLHLFYPDRGDYVGAVGDVKSRRLLAEFADAWRAASSFPLAVSILPGVFSSLALSDQLNFWDRGYPALMLSDTAFYRNPNYHESTDLPDTLDYEKMAQATRALVQALRGR